MVRSARQTTSGNDSGRLSRENKINLTGCTQILYLLVADVGVFDLLKMSESGMYKGWKLILKKQMNSHRCMNGNPNRFPFREA
jgi:hypothetical protein